MQKDNIINSVSTSKERKKRHAIIVWILYVTRHIIGKVAIINNDWQFKEKGKG